MKIADSSISMYSERTAVELSQRREQLTAWTRGDNAADGVRGEGSAEGRGRPGSRPTMVNHGDLVSLSKQARNHIRRQIQPEQLENVTSGEDDELNLDLNFRLLQSLFERITGRKFQVIDPRSLLSGSNAGVGGAAQGADVAAESGAGGDSAGFGLVYDYRETRYEYESTSFAASGVVNTADGKQIDISLSLNMTREFYSEQSSSLRLGDALKDPLVINYSGTAAQLGQRDFQFDIDADGSLDQIAFVGKGSGFLALDKNGDGSINDGSELFGALTGDGFAELAGYDGDNNGWIDENDSIYDKLRIWSRTSSGETQLVSLGQAGVGAIYLGHLETMFSLNDSSNEQLGQVRSSGMALMESGLAVSMQQLDLVA